MTSESLATVFGPNILRSPTNDIAGFLANMGPCNRAMRLLISHVRRGFSSMLMVLRPDNQSHTIFDDTLEQEAEAELEREQEEFEFDEPIPEEDEDEELLCNSDGGVEVEEGPATPDDDDDDKIATLAYVTPGPPVLNLNLGSPQSLSFSVAAASAV